MSLTLAWHQGKMNHRVFSRLKLALLHRRFMFVWSLSVWTLKAQSDVWTDEALEVLHPSLKRTITIFKREKLWLRLTEGPVVFSRSRIFYGSAGDPDSGSAVTCPAWLWPGSPATNLCNGRSSWWIILEQGKSVCAGKKHFGPMGRRVLCFSRLWCAVICWQARLPVLAVGLRWNNRILLLYESVAFFFVPFLNKVSKFVQLHLSRDFTPLLWEETDICAKLARKSFCYSVS